MTDLSHWTKGSTIWKMRRKAHTDENHIPGAGKDISSNVSRRHTAGQGTNVCGPWQRQPLTYLPTRKTHSRGLWGWPARPWTQEGEDKKTVFSRELLVKTISQVEKKSFLSTTGQHKSLWLWARWRTPRGRGAVNHSPRRWKISKSTFVNSRVNLLRERQEPKL